MPTTKSERLFTAETWIFLLFVTLLAFLTYFYRYDQPSRVFWDENYHIASAQKYLNGVYFMEQHPPLGKLLIALGEKIFHPAVNGADNQYIGTDYATNIPDSFSFVGFRFFSALLGWWTAPILFLIFLLLTRNSLYSSLLSFFYVFDNALIVHIRGAMLEGPLMFFVSLTILFFLLALRWRARENLFLTASFFFGVSFALALTTKLFALVLILLVPALLFVLLPHWKQIGKCIGVFAVGFFLFYVTVWQIHFSLGGRIEPKLPDNGYYQASQDYKNILAAGTNGSLLNFPVMLRDSLAFVSHYNNGAPRLDLCKADENGSPFYFWPLGARSISYRWETPDGKSYRYLYLQSNPIVWFVSLAGLLVAICLLVGSVLFPLQKPMKNRFLLSVFVGIYICYMIAVSQIQRVLYLYHYFIPLFLTFIIFALVVMELEHIDRWKITKKVKTASLFVLAALIFASYQFYRPLTYYEPLTDAQFNLRSILPVWELSCVHCKRVNGVAVPNK